MFTCETCGDIEYVLLDGYAVGGRLLERVFFEIRHHDGAWSAKPQAKFADYMKNLNEAKWNRAMAEHAEDTCADGEWGRCQTCGGDVELDSGR